MVDLAPALSIWRQIQLVAGLRWRILRNKLRQKSNWADLIGMVAAAILGAAMILGLSFAFYSGAFYALSTGKLGWLVLLFWGIFLFWQLFPLFLAGFGSGFEFRSLLRFPFNLSTFYAIGLAYGFADFAALASVCWMAAMLLGASVARPQVLYEMVPIIIVFVLLNVTAERLIGSWMERLLARRRSREIIFGLCILLSVSAQFLRPLLEKQSGGNPAIVLTRLLPYLAPFPPSLASQAVTAAVEGHMNTSLYAGVGLIAWLFAASALLWWRYAVQYRGEELSETSAPSVSPVAKQAAPPDADALAVLSPQVAAMLRKDFRYLQRNGFVLISLLMAPLLVLLFTSQFGGKHPSTHVHWVGPDNFFPGMMAYLVLLLMTPAYNCFAHEGHGIKTYFTAPLSFRNVLLGKNLTHGAIISFEIVLSIVLLIWRIGAPSLPVFVATITAVVFAVVGQFAIANWASLSFPRKLEFGSMRGQRNSGVSIWLAFGVQLLLTGISSLILFSGRWTGNRWLPAEAFLGLAIAAIAGYVASLDSLAVMAERKRKS